MEKHKADLQNREAVSGDGRRSWCGDGGVRRRTGWGDGRGAVREVMVSAGGDGLRWRAGG